MRIINYQLSIVNSKSNTGFTLIEILIAITIITILGAVAGVVFLNQIPKANVAKAKMEINALKTAVTLYAADNGGAVPTPKQGLEILLVSTPTQPGGYLDTPTVPLDPWGNPYVYLVPGSRGELFEIISYGADGEPGGDGFNADISSSNLK